MKKLATLRTCASCEWIYKGEGDCPKCGFGSYGARYVYGDKCYTYQKKQTPWREKKLFNYEMELLKEIRNSQYKENK